MLKSPSTLAIIFVEVEIQQKQSFTKLNDRQSISFSGKQAMTVNNASVPRMRNRVSVRLETASGKTANKFTDLSA